MRPSFVQREVFPSITLALLLNIPANLLSLHRYSYDAYTHVFFASHYMRDWFSLWEPRWYGGFSVASYPPLVHQLLALTGFAVGTEASYQLLSVVSALLLVLSLYGASSIFLDRSEAKYVAVAASLNPSLYLLLYVYGQLPTVLAASFSFLAALALKNFLVDGGVKDVAYLSLFSVLVASCHHFTLVFFFPLVMLLTFLRILVKGRLDFGTVLKRLLVAGLVSVSLVIIVMEPFVMFLAEPPAQAEIPHGSRGNIFANPSHSLLFFWGVYGFTVALIPVGFLLVRRRVELLPLLGTFMFLFVMGLGDVTPVPRLLLGSLWYVLTYDRFAVWASLLFAFVLGIIVKDAHQLVEKYWIPQTGERDGIRRRSLNIALLVGLAASSVFTLSLDSFLTPTPATEFELQQTIDFLSKNGDERYITLGFNQGFMELSAISSSETVDGGFNLARRLPVLVDSGVERVDTAIHYGNGTVFLKRLFSEAPELGLKWAVLAKSSMPKHYYDYYVDILGQSGGSWRVIDGTSFGNYSRIEIWECVDTVGKPEIQRREEFNAFQVATWAFGPISSVVAVSALCILDLRKGHGSESG